MQIGVFNEVFELHFRQRETDYFLWDFINYLHGALCINYTG